MRLLNFYLAGCECSSFFDRIKTNARAKHYVLFSLTHGLPLRSQGNLYIRQGWCLMFDRVYVCRSQLICMLLLQVILLFQLSKQKSLLSTIVLFTIRYNRIKKLIIAYSQGSVAQQSYSRKAHPNIQPHCTLVMDIQSILNPVSEGHLEKLQKPSVNRQRVFEHPKSELPQAKRQRLAKDAAIFTKSSPRGRVRFPPYEAGGDELLLAQYSLFRIHPKGNIGDYCRHIPYNSEKKSFLTKTGRDCFEGDHTCSPLSYTLITDQLGTNSFSVRIQDTWGGQSLHSNVGL